MLQRLSKVWGSLSPERFFLVTALIFGVLFVFIVPPFNNPDEPTHLFRVYQLSTLHLFGEQKDESILTTVPASFIDVVKASVSPNGKDLYFHPENKITPAYILNMSHHSLNEHKTNKTPFSGAATYSPTSYIAQVIVMWLGRLLRLPPIILLYTIRLAGLGLYVGAVYYALKILPYRKWTIALIALLPMSLAQASAVTADSSLIASLILFMAIVLYTRSGGVNISTSMKILLALTTIVLGMSKQVFVLAIPLLFFVPSEVFASRQRSTRYKWALGLAVLVLACIWGTTNPSIQNLARPVVANDVHSRISITLHHPIHLAIIATNTFFTTNSNGLYTTLAGDFGWLDTPLPVWAVGGILGVLFYCLATEYGGKKLRPIRYYNRSIAVIAAGLFTLTCVVFYLYWTPIGSRQILGLQGRYFIPVIVLIALLQGKKLFQTSEKQYKWIVLVSTPIMLAASILTIISRFYLRVQ